MEAVKQPSTQRCNVNQEGMHDMIERGLHLKPKHGTRDILMISGHTSLWDLIWEITPRSEFEYSEFAAVLTVTTVTTTSLTTVTTATWLQAGTWDHDPAIWH